MAYLQLEIFIFNRKKIRNLNANSHQSLAAFEKIRTVGKGAYGTAVLYRKKDDDSLVILKEINLHDLNASERQLALNEVKLLSIMDHPNIVSYFDSFEEDGILMIEMEYADGGTLSQMLLQAKWIICQKKTFCISFNRPCLPFTIFTNIKCCTEI